MGSKSEGMLIYTSNWRLDLPFRFESALLFDLLATYGTTTMGQITDGKHMYRALEAHMILYLTLYKNYVQNLVENNIVVEKDLWETITAAITNL